MSTQCLNQADHSAFQYIIENGSYTFKARTIIQSLSAPAWTSMLCAMPTEDSGVTTNDWIAQKYFKRVNRISMNIDEDTLPCIFQEIKKQNPKMKNFSVYNWDFFMNLGNTITPGVLDEEIYKFTRIDFKEFSKSDNYMVNSALKLFEKDFNFFFLYLGALDMSGHDYSWCGEEYIQRLNIVNQQLEIILQKLKNLNILEEMYIIISSDHGGSGRQKWHGEIRDDNIHVPLLIMGPGIKKNHEIESYAKILDISPTIMKILGLEANPYWRGRVIEDVFVK